MKLKAILEKSLRKRSAVRLGKKIVSALNVKKKKKKKGLDSLNCRVSSIKDIRKLWMDLLKIQ